MGQEDENENKLAATGINVWHIINDCSSWKLICVRSMNKLTGSLSSGLYQPFIHVAETGFD
jgi:hypothetical protein